MQSRFWTRPSHAVRALALLWLLLMLLLQPALARKVCIVSSDKTAVFQEAADNLSQELLRSGLLRQDIQVLAAAEFADPANRAQDTQLLVTLGTDALRQVLLQSPRIPVLAGLIPRVSYERVLADSGHKGQATVAALYLDQPFGRQLDLLRLALPQARRVGVLWGPESLSQQSLLAAAASQHGMELVEGVYSEDAPLISGLRSALGGADVLLAVADASVYNRASLSNILLTSYRGKTPVMAFSPAYVKAGALLSLHTTAMQASTRLAALALHFLQNNSLPASQYPGDFSVSVNEYVARSLGLALDADALSERLHRLEKKP